MKRLQILKGKHGVERQRHPDWGYSFSNWGITLANASFRPSSESKYRLQTKYPFFGQSIMVDFYKSDRRPKITNIGILAWLMLTPTFLYVTLLCVVIIVTLLLLMFRNFFEFLSTCFNYLSKWIVNNRNILFKYLNIEPKN